MKNNFNIGIIGAGLMGHRRAEAIKTVGGSRLVAVSDVNFEKAKELAEKHGAEAVKDWRDLLKIKNINAVVISVPNKFSIPIAIEAIRQGKHVLTEKPLGRDAKDAKKIIAAEKKYKKIIRVGFNHRFHAAILKAKEIFDSGKIGKLMYIRARYGNGGRKGMEKEWRFQKAISGGGELHDQGVHIIDLARFFAGEFREVYGSAETKFWKAEVEDNAFVMMKNPNTTAFFHVSATQWKNIFSFEIFGDLGYLNIEGKGGSYGKETLIFGRRRKEFGAPKIKKFEWNRDTSWEEEWKAFLKSLNKKSNSSATTADGLKANQIVEAIYKSSKQKKLVAL